MFQNIVSQIPENFKSATSVFYAAISSFIQGFFLILD